MSNAGRSEARERALALLYEAEMKHLDPLEVLATQVWVTPFWEDEVSELLADVPADRMLLGSDWPHAEGVVEPVDFITNSLAFADETTLRRIARDNAAELLGVSVP